jgi:hypothetical protein
MSDIEDDLRATSESVESDAERLAAIEREKQSLNADDPRLVTLSDEAARLAREIQLKAEAERDIAGEASTASA